MHFEISLSLREWHWIKELLCVKDVAGKSSNMLLVLPILKKNQNSLESNCVEVSF